MTEEPTNSQLVYSLWQAGKRNFERTQAAQVDLSNAADALRAVAQRLPEAVAREVDKTLPAAAEKAANAIASRWHDANAHADRAAIAYQEATERARKTIYGSAAFVLAVFAALLLVLGVWLLPSFEDVVQMRAEKAQLEATIDRLTHGGAIANVQACRDSLGRDRVCVRVDETAKVADKSLRVIRGY
jgi:hypothetical protein